MTADDDFDDRDGGLSALRRRATAASAAARPAVWVHARCERRPRNAPSPTSTFTTTRANWWRGCEVCEAAGSPRPARNRSATCSMPINGAAGHRPGRDAVAVPVATGRWLIFADRAGLGDRLADHLRAQGRFERLVRFGRDLDPADPAAIARLVADEHSAPTAIPARGSSISETSTRSTRKAGGPRSCRRPTTRGC